MTCTITSETGHIFKHQADLHDDCLIFTSSYAIHANAFKTNVFHQQALKISLMLPSLDFAVILPLHTATILSMNTADYWLMAREYSI